MSRDERVITSPASLEGWAWCRWSTGQTLCAVTREDHKSLIYWSDFMCRDERVITSRWSTGQTLRAVTREWSQVVDLLVRPYVPWRESDHRPGISGSFSLVSLIYWSDFICGDERVITSPASLEGSARCRCRWFQVTGTFARPFSATMYVPW